MSDIQMVIVPSGLTADGTALLRVLVLPRLDSGTLADFGLDDWPSVLAGAPFELLVSTGGQSRTANSARMRDLRARSEIWQAFFSGDGAIISDGGRGRAGSVNVAPTHGPAAAATALYRNTAIDMAGPGPSSQTMSQHLQSWQPAGQTPPGPAPAPPSPLLPPQVDFDRVLAMVRQHPTVLTDLGLVFELEADPGELGATSAGPVQGLLSLRCPEQPLRSLVVPPWTWTRYELSDQGFWPASGTTSTPQIEHGAIDLSGAVLIDGTTASGSPPPWAVTVMDVDGAIDGLNAAAGRLGRAAPDRDAVLPGLRSAGLVLLRPNRGSDVSSRLSAASRFDAARPAAAEHSAAEHSAAEGSAAEDSAAEDSAADTAGAAGAADADAVLSAEDLLLGYRADIRTGDDPVWRSLCKRSAAYSVNGMPIGTGSAAAGQPGSVIEEGHLSSLAATRDANGDLHADEVVLRWNGWSLAVPDIDLLQQRDPGPPAPLPYNFTWTYQVPGQSLPQLRFSSRYQLRIRVADVTGGGLTEDAGNDAAPPTDTIIYTRHDPIQPPTLALTEPATLGAGVERLVVRSDDHAANVTDSDVRQITPPAASRQLVEQHGMFDAGVTDEQSWAWAQQAMRVDAPGAPGDRGSGQSAPTGLPDPAANGINAFLPAQADVAEAISERIDWYPGASASWPDAEPKSIRLSAAPTAPASPTAPAAPNAPPTTPNAPPTTPNAPPTTPNAPPTTPNAPPTTPNAPPTTPNAPPTTPNAPPTTPNAPPTTPNAPPTTPNAPPTTPNAPPTTPNAPPTTPNAPPAGPTATPAAPIATIGWSGAVLDVQLAVGREIVLELSSTLRPGFLDHFAIGNWLFAANASLDQTEVGRNPVLCPVRPVQFVHAVRKPLTSPQWNLPPTAIGRTAGSTHADLSPAFDDTGLDPGSTGRLEVHASWPEPIGADVSGAFVHGEPMPAAGPVSWQFLHDFGDTKHRTVTYTLTAISRFRQYFDHGDEPDANFQLMQPQASVNVLSTVQPPEVKVTSVVPSFAWTTTAGDSRIEHTRSSWRLRLELSGSWYRTGIGERLAVVLAPDGAEGSPSFSALGRDPVSATAPAGPVLLLPWCAEAAATVPGFPLPGGGTLADLALYDVFADGDSYYCDIELRPPSGATASYAPLVRLSVARYQPDSLTGLELSAPTLTDWAQLLPDRHVAVDRTGQGLSVLIDGLGQSAPNAVEVVLEELTGDLADAQLPEAVVAIDSDDTAGVPVWRAATGSAVARGAVGAPIAVPLSLPAAHPQRLRIREIEQYGISAGTVTASAAELTQRSAYIDVINLPRSWTFISPAQP